MLFIDLIRITFDLHLQYHSIGYPKIIIKNCKAHINETYRIRLYPLLCTQVNYNLYEYLCILRTYFATHRKTVFLYVNLYFTRVKTLN